MEHIDFDTLTKEGLEKVSQSVTEAINGIGSLSYQTATKAFAAGINQTVSDGIGRLGDLIQKLQEVEQAYNTLTGLFTQGQIAGTEFAARASEMASEMADLKSEISTSNGLPEDPAGDADKLLGTYQGFFAKMTSLYSSYQQDVEALEAARKQAEAEGNDERKKIIEESLAFRVKSLLSLASQEKDFAAKLSSNLSKLSYKELTSGIDQITKKIGELKEKVDSGTATESENQLIGELEKVCVEANEAKEKLSLLEKIDFEGAGTKLKGYAGQLDAIQKSVSSFDSSTGGTIATISDVISGAGDMAKGMAGLLSGTDIIGGTLSVIQGGAKIVSSIKGNIAENKKIREGHLKYLQTEITKEGEYNAVLRERLRLGKQIGEVNTAYFSRMRNELAKQTGDVSGEYTRLFDLIKKEDYVSEQNYKHGTWFTRAKVWHETESLRNKSYEEMELLHTQGKLTENAKLLFERLQKLKQEGKDLKEEIQKLEQEMKAAWTGTTSGNLVDSIAKGFMDGKKSAQDFAKDFEGLMKNAMMQALKMKYLEEKLDVWYADFAEKSESGGALTKDEINALQSDYNGIVNGFAENVKIMEQVAGIRFSAAADSMVAPVAQKGLAAMTQNSADELNGRFYSLLLVNDEIKKNTSAIHSILFQAADQWGEIAENTRYCRKLETIETDMRGMRSDISSMALNGIKLIR